jgi:hypothetical protein
MADVFISYAREDRGQAQALADYLRSQGVEVWWDEQILGSDDFYDVILAALSRAKAAVVIWTKSSVKSRFVRDEARFALHHDKLVATKEAGLDVIEIPFGFQSQHTDDISERDRIFKAVQKLGVKPVKIEAAATELSAAHSEWQALKGSSDPEMLLDYLARHPASPFRTACLERLRELTLKRSVRAEAPVAAAPDKGAFRSFLSGFSFRMPKFQSLSDGTFAAFGSAAFYVILAVAAPVVIMNTMTPQPYGFWTLGGVTLLLTLFGLQRYWSWRKQRNFTAAVITAIAASGIFGMSVWSAGVLFAKLDRTSGLYLWPGGGVALLVVLLVALYRAR